MTLHPVFDAATTVTAGEDCNWLFTACLLSKIPGGDPTQAVTDAVLGPVGASMMAGWSQMDMFFLASWISVPILVDITDPQGTTLWLQFILGNLTFIAAVVGTLVSAGYTFIKLGWERLKNLGWRLGVLMLINLAGAPGIALIDRFIRDSSIGLLQQVGITATSTVATLSLAGISAAILILIGIVAILAVIIQWAIMIARGAIVPVLIGVWPLSAAIATMGGQAATRSFNAITAWLVAFVTYILPAAIVYAAAFRLKSGYDGLGGIMYGFVLELLAVFMLPALLRILAPHTTKLGSAYGGKIAMEGAISVAETAVTVGAAVVTAGAAAGLLAGAGAGAGAGGSTAATSAGGSTSAPAGATPPTGAPTTGAPPNNPSTAEPAGTGDTGTGAIGAEPTSAEPPTGAAPDAAPEQSADAWTGATAGTTPEPRSTPAPASAPAPAGAQGAARSGADRNIGYTAQQAAHAVNATASRSARQAINDVDDIIGGKHE
ncbi:hypothetical protein [Plantibacter sp. CFBP 8804]|uniref:hypothetical protein n=1 Tax=Plantibacter sp. CFBP 8804 TaxID=2775270 RepID=UPI00177FF439|nr:hypothetical protein [Plantibacter sp. CFBP 8804]MBD8519142.1 hypothetical protein [Plantibacter sp. CFBP 8804]